MTETRQSQAVQLPDTSSWGEPDWGIRVDPRPGRGLHLADLFVGRHGEVPEEAPGHQGFAHRGSAVDPQSPDLGFPVLERDAVWAESIADLVEQAKDGQWNATTDIAWAELRPLPEELEEAVCQVCTFLLQNEYLALYLPAKLIGKVDPRFHEVVLFLASQVEDEARHVEVFSKRALANGGGLRYVDAATGWSLKSLYDQEDFSSASFLLHILGEGTFMELLQFLEDFAPDPVSAQIFKLARRDEGRHVGYGVNHIGYHLRQDPALMEQLVRAAEERTTFLRQVAGGSPFVQRALATLAGQGDPAAGLKNLEELYRQMHETRVKRLMQVGFPPEVARRVSELHGTSVRNFM